MISRPRPAATICVFRSASGPDEVLMVQRTRKARFMGGAWVFPGGGIDEADREGTGGSEIGAAMTAARRELAEETGITLPERHEGMVYFARWITPTAVPVRFDTHFFAARVGDGVVGEADGNEIDDLAWISPAGALDRAASGEWLVPFPTQMTLRFLGAFPDLAALEHHVAAAGGVTPVQPRLRLVDDGPPEVLMPGDPGFEEVGDLPPPADDLLRRIAMAGGRSPMPELGSPPAAGELPEGR